jgi:hypothetical protein
VFGAEPILRFSATTDNVAGAPDSIRIDLLRWSTDMEREQLVSAWNMTGAPASPGRGSGRGRAGRGGRGAVAPAEGSTPATPESTLALALKQVPTVGYLWSSEVAGYAIRYAGKVPGANGVDRILLITDRRLGRTNDLWKPVSGTPSAYDFSVIELRVNAKGEGEGKISLVGKVVLEPAAKIVAPEDYNALPVVLKNLKRRTESL